MEFDSHASPNENNCITPTKKLLTFHGVLSQHQHQTNNYQTPPSRVTKIKNPFEHVLREHLGTNFISPSLFVKRTPVKKDFKWTIDELSVLKPAEIDETSIGQFQSPEREEHDAVTQSRIDSYFSMQQIIPSPMQPVEAITLYKSPASPTSVTSSSVAPPPQTTTQYAQTVLSLPPSLPEEVENVLRPYFSFTQDQSQQNVGCDVRCDSALYKKLFDDEDDASSPLNSSCEEADGGEAAPKPDGFSSPVRMLSEYKHSTFYQRTIGTPGNYDEMNLCPLSPICLPIVNVQEKQTEPQDVHDLGKNSSQVMSIDGSFNVPDCSLLEKYNNSQLDSSHHSSEALSTSTMNWDLEYNHMSSPLPSTRCATLEVTRLSTPKQRQVISQRKKLSDSFGNDAQAENDAEDYMVVSQQSIKADNWSESGYHTVSSSMSDTNLSATRDAAASTATTNNMWESLDVVSSTPTKRKQCFS